MQPCAVDYVSRTVVAVEAMIICFCDVGLHVDTAASHLVSKYTATDPSG